MIMENGEELAAMEFTPQRIYRIHPPPLKYQVRKAFSYAY